jgi:hypothetical protein
MIHKHVDRRLVSRADPWTSTEYAQWRASSVAPRTVLDGRDLTKVVMAVVAASFCEAGGPRAKVAWQEHH